MYLGTYRYLVTLKHTHSYANAQAWARIHILLAMMPGPAKEDTPLLSMPK